MKSTQIKSEAQRLGFNLCGITRAEPSPHLVEYYDWLQAGRHGELGYLAREDRLARRGNLENILPGAKTLIMVGLDYLTPRLPEAVLTDPSRGRIAAYAWGQDYHDIMTPRLQRLADHLAVTAPGPVAHRVYVDTGAVLERSHAQRAGLGFQGKNTMLINPRRGAYFFLGEILLDIEVDDYDQPHREKMCGTCTRCLSACPTGALVAPYTLDARLCISYLTIEKKGWIEPELRPRMSNWILGCDICQEVCPWQRFGIQTLESAFVPVSIDRAAPPLVDLLSLDDEAFRARYRGTPIFRLKRDRLIRNACVAAGNWGHSSAWPHLRRLLDDPSPIVRGHAAWAIDRIDGRAARPELARRLPEESDPEVRAEWSRLIDQVPA